MKHSVLNAVTASCIFATASYACTGITLTGADGTTIFARTLEWGTFDLAPEILVIPRGTKMNASVMPDGAAGHEWSTTYGVAGITALGKPLFGDVMNEEGLVVGTFYLPGFTEYQIYEPDSASVSLGSSDFAGFIATQYGSVSDVRSALESIRVVPVVEPAIGIPPPLHFMVSDPSGEAIVIQYIGGKPTIFEAPLGVITNAPNYDWHITNLNNYLNLSAVALPPVEAGGQQFAPLGAGSGMLGLPGDFTPPSRFVRAVAFS
ncbi:linear amide C-N hydrolase [Ruegeria sp. HKCCA4812]|nr:linear amide C-N hydrolase [Ruegeria sp. HKCCA4812]